MCPSLELKVLVNDRCKIYEIKLHKRWEKNKKIQFKIVAVLGNKKAVLSQR